MAKKGIIVYIFAFHFAIQAPSRIQILPLFYNFSLYDAKVSKKKKEIIWNQNVSRNKFEKFIDGGKYFLFHAMWMFFWSFGLSPPHWSTIFSLSYYLSLSHKFVMQFSHLFCCYFRHLNSYQAFYLYNFDIWKEAEHNIFFHFMFYDSWFAIMTKKIYIYTYTYLNQLPNVGMLLCVNKFGKAAFYSDFLLYRRAIN